MRNRAAAAALGGLLALTRRRAWTDSAFVTRTAPDEYEIQVAGLKPGQPYEFRAAVRHPLLTAYGEERPMTPPPRP